MSITIALDDLLAAGANQDILRQLEAQPAPATSPRKRSLLEEMRDQQQEIIRRNASTQRPATEAKPTPPAPAPTAGITASISVKGHPLIAACYLSGLRFGEAKVTYRPDQQQVFVEIDINMLWIADLRRNVARYRVGEAFGRAYPIPALTTPELLKILDIARSQKG